MILINPVPPNRMGLFSHYSAVTLPISVGILAGYLRAHGKNVEVIDEQLNPIDESLSFFKKLANNFEQPYVFGVSCLTSNISRGLQIAKILKKFYPDSKIIFGGIHPTVLPEESLQSKDVDIVVRGEGELSLLLLYEAIKAKKDYSSIPGISYRAGDEIKHNPDAPLVADLDSISRFPYELFDMSKYKFNAIVASRGCPHNCIFCSQRAISGFSYRSRSSESIIGEVDVLVHTYQQNSVGFIDDDFLANKKMVKDICGAIIKSGYHLKAKFSCQARGDNVDEETLSWLKDAGFNYIILGLETASERLMKIIQKGETVERNIQAVRLIKKFGFSVGGYFLYGLPSETRKDRFQSFLLARSLKLDYATFSNVVPYPGTRLYNVAKEEEALSIQGKWENFNPAGSVVSGIFSYYKLPYIPKDTSEKELRRDLFRANAYFYLMQRLPLRNILKKNYAIWFSPKDKWFFNPKEVFIFLKFTSMIIVQLILVFDLKWILKRIPDKKIKDSI